MIFELLKNKPSILIISPHADDEIIGCGGLIAAAKYYESKVNVLYMTVGSSRQLITGKTEAETRLKEIKKVSKLGNFEYEILYINKNFVMLDTVPQKEIIDSIEDKIQIYKPDIVCIPFSGSYNQDHRATYTACITALRPIPQNIRHFPKLILEYEEPYTWNCFEHFCPNAYLNTESFYNLKLQMMKKHKSQNRPDPFARSVNNLKRQMQIRGAECGYNYAEAYKILRCIL